MSVLRVTADLSNLPAVREHVHESAGRAGLPDGSDLKIDLVIEEVLVNIVNHAYRGDGGPLEVECAVRDGAFCCIFRDWGPPFNPLEADAPDVGQPLDDRPIGGLGIFLAITMPDTCSYMRRDDVNELTFCFSLSR
jgi:anti-sigma regulatory factor (Ser/Thr protein kinase)